MTAFSPTRGPPVRPGSGRARRTRRGTTRRPTRGPRGRWPTRSRCGSCGPPRRAPWPRQRAGCRAGAARGWVRRPWIYDIRTPVPVPEFSTVDPSLVRLLVGSRSLEARACAHSSTTVKDDVGARPSTSVGAMRAILDRRRVGWQPTPSAVPSEVRLRSPAETGVVAVGLGRGRDHGARVRAPLDLRRSRGRGPRPPAGRVASDAERGALGGAATVARRDRRRGGRPGPGARPRGPWRLRVPRPRAASAHRRPGRPRRWRASRGTPAWPREG